MNIAPKRFHADTVAVCPVGLESVCASELRGLGLRVGSPTSGVVPFRGSTRAIYETNLWLRTATRVLVRIARFRATDFAHLERRVAELDLGPYLSDGVAPRFRVSTRKSALYHTDAVTERLHRVVGPPKTDDDAPEQAFVVRIDHDTVTMSVDTTGEPLHRRSWRTETVGASLRPTIAAGAVLLSAWDSATPLIDPFAGSGTFVVEAGLIAVGRPPSPDRQYAFHAWPSFEGGTWASVTGTAATRIAETPRSGGLTLTAFDRDREAIRVTLANAERAGVVVLADVRPIGRLTGEPGAGLVVSNPPYGKRVPAGPAGVTPLYRRFGEVVRERRPGHALTVVVPKGERLIDRRLRTLARADNGGIGVKISTYVPTMSTRGP